MPRKYFGTDGIRGRANAFPVTPEFAMKIGQAAGIAFQRGEHRHRVMIGKDTRLSGYMIENALVGRLHCRSAWTCCSSARCRRRPSAMLTRSMRADLGVMISASHNPFDDNGIKLFGPDGYKLSDAVEREIESADPRRGRCRRSSPRPRMLGRAKRIDDAAGPLHRVRQTHPAHAASMLVGPEHRRRLRQRCRPTRWRPAALWELGRRGH